MDRKNRIGGSDVAALFGLDPYKSYWRLWHEKAGNIEPEDLSDNEDVEFGREMESRIAWWFGKKNNLVVQPHTSLNPEPIKHSKINGFAGIPDYWISKSSPMTKENTGILEVKSTGWRAYDKWKNTEPPLHYQLQLQAYMGLTGCRWGMLAILVDRKLLPPFEYEFRPKIFTAIEQKVIEFWQSIKEGREPEQGDDSHKVSLVRKYLVDDAVDLSNDEVLAPIVALYAEEEKRYKTYYRAYKTACNDKKRLTAEINNLLFSRRINSNNVICNGAQLLTETCPDVVVKEHTRKGGQKLIIKLNGEENE